jgi:hypothetical protein
MEINQSCGSTPSTRVLVRTGYEYLVELQAKVCLWVLFLVRSPPRLNRHSVLGDRKLEIRRALFSLRSCPRRPPLQLNRK